MNKQAQYEVSKMNNLMERMEKHLTALQVSEGLEEINEEYGAGRTNYQTLDQLLNNVKLANGTFVGLGYIQGYEAAKIYPLKDDFGGKLNKAFGEMDPQSRAYGKIQGLMNSPEMTNPTGRAYKGFKSVNNSPIQGILMVANYVFNWGDTSSLASSFQKMSDDITDLRRKSGFGFPEDTYADDDWRRKPEYRGLTAMPAARDKRKNPDGSDVVGPFHQSLNPEASLFGDTDSYGNPKMTTDKDGNQYQRRAFRFNLSNIRNQWKDYAIVDQNGEIDEVASSLSILFSKKQAPKNIEDQLTDEMSEDEKNYLRALSQIEIAQNKAIKEWITDNVAYLVVKGVNRMTGEKEAARWVNTNIIITNINVNDDDLATITGKEAERATKDVMR